MGCFKQIFSNPITQLLSDAAAIGTGNPELIPVINAGETLAGGGSLGDAAKVGGLSFAGQELAPVLGNAFRSIAPETASSLGIGGGANSLTDLLGQTTGGGSLFGPGTIGGDVLGNFTPGSGLESLLGGTPQPESNFSAVYPNLGTVSTPGVAADATNPASFAAGGDYGAGGTPVPGAATGPGTFSAPTGASSAAGGASGGGFDVANAGESSALPSASGAGAGIGTSPSTGLNALTDQFGLTTPNAATAGTFNYDISGAPAGASSYSIPQQFSNSIPTGGSPVIPSSGGYSNLLNGLLKAGTTGLLNNPNNKGYDAQINAAHQIENEYQPFVNTGTNASNMLAALLGQNGTTAADQAAARADFQNTPGYQFALDQGLKAVNADAAAKGQLLSGNNQQAIQQYGSGLANQTYNNYLQNLESQIGTGLNAAGGVASGIAGMGNAQAGKSGAGATNQNNTIAQAANAMFPTQGINLAALFGPNSSLMTGGNNNGVLNYLFQ